jgi:hypothetical protein
MRGFQWNADDTDECGFFYSLKSAWSASSAFHCPSFLGEFEGFTVYADKVCSLRETGDGNRCCFARCAAAVEQAAADGVIET